MQASNVKYDAPAHYDGSSTPGVRVWLTQMERYMRLTRMPAADQFDYVATRCTKSASSWINARLLAIERGDLANWGSWEELKADMIKSFEPSTAEEQAWKQLRNLTQTGRVSGYVARFRELQYRLP